MCKFKSGIITRDGRVLLSQSDSHSDILAEHNIKDNTTDPKKKSFCRFEYVPKGQLWEFDKYVLKIDEEVIPTWLDQRLKNRATKTTNKWLSEHILYNQKIGTLEKGYYYAIIDCEINKICGTTHVEEIYGSAQVNNICGSAQVKWIYGSAHVEKMCGSAHVKEIYGSAQVNWISESAVVKRISGYAIVRKDNIIYCNNKNIILQQTTKGVK